MTADAVQEWSIKGAGNHPFHLHVYHFQAQAGCGGDFEEGEFYDTLAANCSVRFDLDAATSSVYAGARVSAPAHRACCPTTTGRSGSLRR